MALGILAVVETVLGAVSSFGDDDAPSWTQQAEPNAVIMLVWASDTRQRPAALLSTRLRKGGGDATALDGIALYLIGAKVRVDAEDNGRLILRARSNAGIGWLRPTEKSRYRYAIDGAGLEEPTYALIR